MGGNFRKAQSEKGRADAGCSVPHGFPDDFEIYFKVAMRDPIAHALHRFPRDAGVLLSKLRVLGK